MNIIFNRTK